MENLSESAEKRHLKSTPERRKHLRSACLIEAFIMDQGCGFEGTIQNIGEGGVNIRSVKGEKLLLGEEVLLVPRSGVLSEQLRGKIAWVGSNCMGVEFQDSEVDCGESVDEQEDRGTSGEECQKVARIKRRKVRWEPSASAEVSYRLYWSMNGAIDYDSDYVDLGKVTQVTLPDDIPSFPSIAGEIELGVSAITDAGNESEIAKVKVLVDFIVPEAPSNIRLEDL